MTWRWTWARSRITALVASGLIWLVAASLSPAFVAGYGLLGIVIVAGWRTRPVLWWRYGVRKVEPVAAEMIWRALVPLEWLRGRNQPSLWAGKWVDRDVVASDLRILVLSGQLLGAVVRHEVANDKLRRLIVRAFATAELNGSRTVALVDPRRRRAGTPSPLRASAPPTVL
jgi:FAD/FMN-containing dehydrogenase